MLTALHVPTRAPAHDVQSPQRASPCSTARTAGMRVCVPRCRPAVCCPLQRHEGQFISKGSQNANVAPTRSLCAGKWTHASVAGKCARNRIMASAAGCGLVAATSVCWSTAKSPVVGSDVPRVVGQAAATGGRGRASWRYAEPARRAMSLTRRMRTCHRSRMRARRIYRSVPARASVKYQQWLNGMCGSQQGIRQCQVRYRAGAPRRVAVARRRNEVAHARASEARSEAVRHFRGGQPRGKRVLYVRVTMQPSSVRRPPEVRTRTRKSEKRAVGFPGA